MAVNVNLLPDLEKEEGKKKKLLKIVNFVTVGFIILTILLFGATFAINGMTEKEFLTVQGSITQQQALIKQHEAVEIKLTEVKSRASIVDNLLTSRHSYYNFMTNIERITPKKVTFESISIDESGGVMMNGQCADYDELLGYVKALSGDWDQMNSENQGETPIFENVQLISASRDTTTGDVRFSISCTTREGAYDVQ